MTDPQTTPQRVFARQRILQVTPEVYGAGIRLLAEAAQLRHGPITAVIGIAKGGLAPTQSLGALLAVPMYRVDARHNPTDALYTQATGHVTCDVRRLESTLAGQRLTERILLVDDIRGTGATLHALHPVLDSYLAPGTGLQTAVLCRNVGAIHPPDLWLWSVGLGALPVGAGSTRRPGGGKPLATRASATRMTTLALILVSWRPDAPAGMERAIAASAIGLTAAGHHAAIITADRRAPARYRDTPVVALDTLTVPDPCGDEVLRAAIDAAADQLHEELLSIFAAYRVDVAVYVDGLWGLGRVMPTTGPVRRVLAVHVVGHDIDMVPALRRAEMVIAPSAVVLQRAGVRGYDSTSWRVVPNALLLNGRPPSTIRRRWLREHGPIRVLARLGPEKGVEELLTAAVDNPLAHRLQVALCAAGFEATPGGQQRLLDSCRDLGARIGATILPGLPWKQVLTWLADSAVVLVPSLAETFGLVALEAMAGGTPVVAFDLDNLPALIGDGGLLVPQEHGHLGLWRAAEELLGDPIRYEQTSRASSTRARHYRPADIAGLLVKAVS